GNNTIDILFESLARDKSKYAAAVILSGSGSDGAAGALCVRQAGGVVIVQDPTTAEFDSMPLAVIETGMANHILPIVDIARELYACPNPDYERLNGTAAWTSNMLETMQRIADHIYRHAGFDLTGYKLAPLMWRVHRRMQARQIHHLNDYEALLADDVVELEILIHKIPIHVTSFFRDEDAWNVLKQDVLHELFSVANATDVIRAWTPACSTGEEAYSLAMLMNEENKKLSTSIDFQIFATDTSAEIVTRASQGIFSAHAGNAIPEELKSDYFYTVDGGYRVKKALREKMVFAPQNLLADPPFSSLDLITCRNLLIYLEPSAITQVLYLLHSALRPGGYLFLGKGESLSPKQSGFEAVSPALRIYRKTGVFYDAEVNFPKRLQKRLDRQTGRISAAENAHRALVETFDLPSVLVDEQFNVLRIHGSTEGFLKLPAGQPTYNLLQMVPLALRERIRVSGKFVLLEQCATTIEGELQSSSKGIITARLMLTPITQGENGSLRLLISFLSADRNANSNFSDEDKNGKWNEALRISMGELDASREELQALNEELRTVNDQLNISNDEITRINQQLSINVEELETQRHILTSGAVMTLFLDQGLRVRWFTPAMKKLFPLYESDTGRRIADLRPKFKDSKFLSDAQAVLEGKASRESEVETESGKWYQRQIRPFSVEGKIKGVAITFADITEQKKAEEALAEELDAISRLRELSDQLLSSKDVSDALYQVLDTAISLHGADKGTIQIHDPETGVLRYIATRGFGLDLLSSIPPIDRDFHSTCAATIRTGHRIVVTDLTSDSQFADHASTAAALNYKAAISSPLKTRHEELQGVLTVHFREPHIPTERELGWADLYAGLAAHLIERRRTEIRLGEREAERKKAESALRESEEKYRSLFESINTGFAIIETVRDDEGRLVDLLYREVNKAFACLTGFQPNPGQSVRELMPDFEDYWFEYYDRVSSTGVPELREDYNADLDRWYYTNANRVGDACSRLIAVIFDDITERKRAERALCESEEKYRLLFNSFNKS
ncbi:MAG: PAS domain-containing protein, partial [Nitrosomonas sp.]|nr:PAS domain-containing protein [Nitrosomonas sp.]